VYGRDYQGKQLNFEASGGLIHWALVMADKETDSYWSILSGESLAGPLTGTPLEELPFGTKTLWVDWVEAHPDTLVLSVDGVEHISENAYERYFESANAPYGAKSKDERLPDKEPVYAFHRGDTAFAVRNKSAEGGRVFDVGAETIFLYRPPGTAVYYSTIAWAGKKGAFEERDGTWLHVDSGAVFDADRGEFVGAGTKIARLEGFDTFWFHWSMTNPDSKVLGK
jgi:hypothetical protein